MPTTTRTSRRIYTAGRTGITVAAPAAAMTTPVITAAPAASASTACCCPACAGLTCLDRTRFFSGQLLSEADLNNEQSYWLAKSRLHNRFLHGSGVVCGMQVVCSECDGWVTVKTGYAIDPCGNDIIVCEDHPFNVIQAIQACCTPPKQSNCAPLRYTPPPTCQDATQTWCITIQYQEQESRMVTSLQQPAKSESCGCGASCKGGCGCGCGGGAAKNGYSNGSSKTTCGCSSTQNTPSSSVPAGACEPTRIVEGFQLGVVCEPQSTDQQQGPVPGTYAYQFSQCYEGLYALILQKPNLKDLGDQPAYQATCNYLTSVRNAFAGSYITDCQLEDALNNMQIPSPGQNNDNYISTLQEQIGSIVVLIFRAALDCFCTSLVPACPPDPCDNRLILACVTVQNGKVINICHFGGRKQVVTFPVLYYWFSLFGFDEVLGNLNSLLELLCCRDETQREGLFAMDVSERGTLTTSGVSNPAMVNRIVTSFVAQKLGAAMVNAASPAARTVDLRPLVGLQLEAVSVRLRSYNINVVQKDVSADPAWTDAAVASAVQYVPAAFNATQPLTMFTRNRQVVGFDVTNPTDVLCTQVQQLQQQVDRLTGQVSAMHPQARGPSSSGNKTKSSSRKKK